MKRLIHHTFGPLVTPRTILTLLLWWRWCFGQKRRTVSADLQSRFGKPAYLFSSGREALFAYLKALELHPGEEVILQGFTCAVLPNAIHAAGGTPIYVDIEKDTLNLDIKALKKAVTPRTRAVIVQHTFGIPADTAAIRALCDKHNLKMIEDCAHRLPLNSRDEVGTTGDAVLLSFGRDKAVFGITGGATVSSDDMLQAPLAQQMQSAPSLPFGQLIQLYLYSFLYLVAKTLWPIGLGKVVLKLAQLLGAMPRVLTREEKRGFMPPQVHRLPAFCAAVAADSLADSTSIHQSRHVLSQLYQAECKVHSVPYPAAIDTLAFLPLQKFPCYLPEGRFAIQSLKDKEIYLYDGWHGAVINPASTSQENCGYESGTCPVAEALAGQVVSLPTHPGTSTADAQTVLRELTAYLEQTAFSVGGTA